MNKKFLFLLALLIIPLVVAQPPFEQAPQFGEGYIIQYPQIGIARINTDFNVNMHLFNISNGVPIDNSTTGCVLHLYNPQGQDILETVVQHEDNTAIKNEWEINIKGGNFSTPGDYHYTMQCNSTATSLGGFATVGFEVNAQGRDYNTATGLIYVTIYLFLIAALGLFLYIFFITPYNNPSDEIGNIINIDKKKYLKLFMLTLSYVTLIGLLYFSWNISYGILEFTEMANFFYGAFRVSVLMFIPTVAIIFVLGMVKAVQDTKIIKELERGFNPSG